MAKYLVTVYKPSSDDYCRGCHMASYSSEFDTLQTDDKEEVIEFASNRLSEELDCGEEGYDYDVYHYCPEEGIVNTYDFAQEIADEKERKLNLRKEFKKRQEEENKKEQLAQTRERERAELKRLQEKYG